MHRGATITILTNGMRISEDNLATIGVFDGSTCWGTWIPDRTLDARNEHRAATAPSHFLASPFEPSSWPVLFRVEMYLNSDRPETLADAIAPLARNGLSILSIDVTPAGHHHAAVTIIGEAIALKAPNGILSFLAGLTDPKRTFRDPAVWDYVHKEYAPEMLLFADSVVKAVEVADEEKSFLREIFLDPKRHGWEPGVLYSYDQLPERALELGREQRPNAVSCTWLQNMAFFWMYRKTDPFELTYDSSRQSLSPAASDDQRFAIAVEPYCPPFGGIGSFNLQERFLRVVLSADDRPRQTVRVKIPFDAQYKAYQGSKGFQHALYHGLTSSRGGFRIRGVSMTTRRRNLEQEEGYLSLLLARTGVCDDFVSIEATRARVQQIANAAASGLVDIGCEMRCSPVSAEMVAAPVLFLSTKFDWVDRCASNLVSTVRSIAMEAGFRLVIANTTHRDFARLVPEISRNMSITDIVVTLIRRSAAFLQILPKSALPSDKQDGAGMNWLLFEFGVARGREIPCHLLVDEDGGEVEQWERSLKIAKNFPLFCFRSTSSQLAFEEVLRNAIGNLAAEVRQNALPREA